MVASMSAPNPVRPELGELIETVIDEARKVMCTSHDLYERRLAKAIVTAGYTWRRAKRERDRMK